MLWKDEETPLSTKNRMEPVISSLLKVFFYWYLIFGSTTDSTLTHIQMRINLQHFTDLKRLQNKTNSKMAAIVDVQHITLFTE